MKDKLSFPAFTHDSIAGYCNGNPLYAQYKNDKKSKYIGTKQMWQELSKLRWDLEIARKALEDMQHWLGVIRCSMVSHLNNQNNTLLEHYETDPTVQNIDKAKRILKHYIEQIEHKE